MEKVVEDASHEFKWLQKRSVGGKGKQVTFYESFIYDGVKYVQYDCVYMYKEGLREPYIGKLIKIWGKPDNTKKVKVQWFFRPEEISKWLGDTKTLKNEIFFASGSSEGVGLANINPLEKSSWFRRLPWEERLKNAYDQGTAILLHNVDPNYTSEEVEDIIWHAFNKEHCEAKILQHTAVSSPHYGQALILLKTKEAAQRILAKLDEECLMLSNGRPLVGTTCPPISLRKNSNFFGHLVIDKIRLQNQREMDEAVSTSHFSQPNTIEYDMAMEWSLLQSRSKKWWEMIHKQQGDELKKLETILRKKRA